MKFAVCDDDVIYCDKMISSLKILAINNNVNIEVEKYHSAESILKVIKEGLHFDFIYMDIYMDGMNGLDAVEAIRNEVNNQETEIVFVSTSRSHYQRAFTVRTFDYLAKPLKEEDLKTNFERILKFVQKNQAQFCYESNGMTCYVKISNIYYFEASNRIVKIHTRSGVLSYYSSMKKLSKTLHEYEMFMRTHTSYIVNIQNVRGISNTKIEIVNGDTVPVSRLYKEKVTELRLEVKRNMFKLKRGKEDE